MIAITTMNKIPEYCYDCPCHDGNNGKCKAANRYSSDDRPNWCPISDAIPVEWLEDKELDYRTTGDKMFSDAFAVVIGEWQKEQEAQDGKV